MGSKIISSQNKAVMKTFLFLGGILGTFMTGSLTDAMKLSSEEGAPVKHSREVRAVDNRTQTPKPDGAVYIRWGRRTCPSEASIIYVGVIGSGGYAETGGGSEYICLSGDPEYATYNSGTDSYSYLYGAEFQGYSSLFNTANMYHSYTNQDGACVACLSIRNTQIMIPGRRTCYGGWHREYYGVLMSAKYSEKTGKNYICVDYSPEADRGGARADGGARLWPVEGRCGALPCPPFEDGKELTCVVCTR